MRVLFTTLGSPSKGRAQLPLARAFAAAGHKVLMATNRSLAPVFEPDDLQVATCMDDFSPASFIPPEQTEQLAGPGLSKEERQEALVRNMVLAMAGPMAAKVLEWVLPVARDFRPDLILRDGMDLGSCLIAEHLGIPQLPTPAGSGNMIDPVEVLPGLNAVREEQGLPTQEDPLSMIPHGRIDCVPGAFSFARHLPPSWCYRQSLAVERHSVLPGWIAELPTHRPVVFAAIGTALAMRRRPAAGGHGGPPPVPSPVETLRSMIKAVSALDECTVIVATSGVAVESDDLPPHAHVTDWVPQPLLLESVDVFLTHGGFNSVREALRTGTPMAVLPQFGDQPSNARRVQELGLGRNITDGTPDGITTALREVLADSGVRAKARQARLAMLALPEVDSAVADMEKIAG